ncbi:MAG TPA: PRC and DUF2382 domain-containing protein [Streptosporangiaceae bacterium]|nr:PRC and DUF2382 domain-containing protein [Streptosporangiaceae bacterium]
MTTSQWQDVTGFTAIGADGEKIGKVGQVYLNDATGQPEWVTVSTGLFGTRESFAPLYNAQPSEGEVRLAVTKQQVKDAPNISTDEHVGSGEIDALYQHYAGYLDPAGSQASAGESYRTGTTGNGTEYAGTTGTEYAGPSGGGAEYGRNEYAGQAGTEYAGTEYAGQGRDTSGPTTDDAMTRSEERLNVGTESVPAGRARLRKYVVTENVTQTVPVSHEEVRVEREPITEANRDAALDGPDISEEEHEVTLRAERPVVEKEAVPVERVRLGTETVTEQHEVNEQVRKEQIDEPGVDTDRRRDGR